MENKNPERAVRRFILATLLCLISLTASAISKITLSSQTAFDKQLTATLNQLFASNSAAVGEHADPAILLGSNDALLNEQLMASLLFDKYLFTLDRDYLHTTVMPFLIDTADNLEQTLGRTDKYGFYILKENNPTENVAAAIFFLRDLISACNILCEHQERVEKFAATLAKMPPYRIDVNDEFMPFQTPVQRTPEQEANSAFLLPLFYRNDPIVMRNYDLTQACRKTIESRLNERAQKSAKPDWELLQLALASAGLGDGETTYRCLMQTKSLWKSCRLEQTIAPIVNKMLLQSYYSPETNKTYLNILAAVPDHWENGGLTDIPVRGAVNIIDLKWDKERITFYLTAKQDLTVDLYIKGKFINTIDVKGGQTQAFTAAKR